MSDEINRRNIKLQRELDQFHSDPVRMAQAQIDSWWQSRLDREFEDADVYWVGGFQERHSLTPSFHKSRRDHDWKIR